MRWIIAEEVGWELEYIDALTLEDVIERGQVRRGQALAIEHSR